MADLTKHSDGSQPATAKSLPFVPSKRVLMFRAWLPKARKSVWSDYGTPEQRQPDRRRFGRMVEFDPLYFSISNDSLQHPQIFTDTPEHFYGEDIEKSQEGAILLQYTGLKDKNGVDIYEGDVVTTDYPGVRNVADYWVVEYGHTGAFRMARGSFKESIHDLVYNDWKLEVVGNIYENPELLADDAVNDLQPSGSDTKSRQAKAQS